MSAPTTIAERLLDPSRPLDVEAAYAHVAATALTDQDRGLVGLELESHLVDLVDPAARVSWDRATDAVTALPAMPGASSVTLEPGGQLELSGPPAGDVAVAVQALREDVDAVSRALAPLSLGVARLGIDPARPARRVNPGPRYAAMERHFDATGRGAPGRAMMCSTASLQVNLDAGARHLWNARVARAHLIGPVLVAVSACSPLVEGRRTGWRSNRQRVWGELDQTRCGPLGSTHEPAHEWADYALCAPVMLVRDPAGSLARAEPVLERVPFRAWAAGDVELGGRRPVPADLDYHLTTLFPPTRLRGFLEVRCLDAAPEPWWPALAAVVALLMDDATAADLATEACEPVAGRWHEAARDGLGDEALAAAAKRCLQAAADAAPPSLVDDVGALADLVSTGRCPGDLMERRADEVGALELLAEQAGGRTGA